MPTTLRPVLLALLAFAPASSAFADDKPAAKKVNYKDDVSAIFQARCNACHNNDKKKGGQSATAMTSS